MREHGMGLLVHMLDFENGHEDAVRSWLGEEHLRRWMEAPGLTGAASYEAIRGAPRFLTLYEAESAHAFYAEAFRALGAEPTARDREMEKLRRDAVRLVCTQIYPGLPIPPPACPTVEVAGLAPVVQLGRIHVAPEDREDFNAWYAQERVPGVEAIPGVRRIRRYAPIEGDPVMVVLYEVEDESVLECPEWKAVTGSAWSKRVRSRFRQAPGSPGVYRRRGWAR